MRARLGMAATLWELGDANAALDHLEEMLWLDEDDRMGVRYILVRYCLELEDDESLEELLEEYEDGSAEWLYTRALTLFRLDGESAEVNTALDEAIDANPLIGPMLLHLKKLPRWIPNRLSESQSSEALDYVSEYTGHWRSSHGALRWLRKRCTRRMASA